MKLFVTMFPLFSLTFPLKPKCFLQHHILERHYLIHKLKPERHFIWWGHFCKIWFNVGKIKFST